MSDKEAAIRQSAAVIDQFLDVLWLERGLSENTLSAYRTDLYSYSNWLMAASGDLLQSRPEDILGYLASLNNKSARTSARRLSSLRRFFQYLAREGHINHDPQRPNCSAAHWPALTEIID